MKRQKDLADTRYRPITADWLWAAGEIQSIRGKAPLQSNGYADAFNYDNPDVQAETGQALLDAHYADWDFGEAEVAARPFPRTRHALRERIATLKAELLLLEARAPQIYGIEASVQDCVA